MLPGEWRPGMPPHWLEQTTFLRRKSYLIRFVAILQLASGIAYLVFRARETIGIFRRTVGVLLAYQIFFLCLEVISISSIIFRFFETWNVPTRNAVDFKRIPNDLIVPHFDHSGRKRVRKAFSSYPSIGVFIPCYNEDANLVLETVLGALNIDYPRELLTVYLCDDGKDSMKRHMISQLRKQYKNIFYVLRPDHLHAKAGNLNYALERTTSDLIVTLDADFVARPNLLQRLLPYYYVWNPAIGMYEFNETLAVVQTPQHFRNLSPYDSDPLDQRSTFFVEVVMPGKDWFNASTMIGTTNLLSRVALQEGKYYPYYSITEDTAMSLCFHSLGYRTFFVNESLATGLATTSLWSNMRQRARWLKGDWQILFSKNGPLCVKGLTILQRIMYTHMTFSRFISVVHMFYDIATVLLLVGGISPLDAPDAIRFIIYIGSFFLISSILRLLITSGGTGVEKSEAGSVMFETIFRYTTVKGLFIALFMGENLKFKVTDKANAGTKGKKKALQGTSGGNEDGEQAAEQFEENARVTVLGRPGPDKPAQGMTGHPSFLISALSSPTTSAMSAEVSDRPSTASVASVGADEDLSSVSDSVDDDGRGYKKNTRTAEEKYERRRNIRKNLKRVWCNIVMAIVLTFSIVWGVLNPPDGNDNVMDVVENGVEGVMTYNNVIPLAMALGFAGANLLPHLLAIYLCFIPYLSGWVMSDLVHGRCDQYAVHPKSGKLFVPWSFISVLNIAKMILILGSMVALGVYTQIGGTGTFIRN